MPGTYISPAESGLYYLNSRYYNAEWGRFINADGELSGVGGDIRGYNLFAYCMNNPINLTDEAGNWPKWLENTIKAVSVVAVVATAAVVVGVATVGTGGFALAAAGVAFGAACGGLVGGISNEKKGESFINGWIGGGVGGLVQSVGTATLNYVGTIVGGGVGSGIGTAITEKLNNRGKSEKYQKSSKEIFNESLQAAAIGTIMSALTAGIDYGIEYAQGSFGYNSWADSLAPGVGIAPITPGFSIMMSGFFGSVDDALANIFWE